MSVFDEDFVDSLHPLDARRTAAFSKFKIGDKVCYKSDPTMIGTVVNFGSMAPLVQFKYAAKFVHERELMAVIPNEIKKFWVVLDFNESEIITFENSKQAAMNTAENMVAKYPDKVFTILEATDTVKKSAPPVQWAKNV